MVTKVAGKTVKTGAKIYPSLGLGIIKGLGKIGSSPFSKNVCPYCHSPTIEIAGRHYCSRDGCPYHHPTACPLCGALLSLDEQKGELICPDKDCEFHKDPSKLHSHVKNAGYGVKEERLTKTHKKRVLRTAFTMVFGAIPMIFPGGTAGLSFALGVWALALEMFFPSKPRDDISMVWKGLGRFSNIGLFALGFNFLNSPLAALFMLLLGYYSLPSGISELLTYKKFLGVLRTILALALSGLTVVALGGPPEFKMSLAAFIFAYLFTIPGKGLEVVESFIFIIAFIIGMILALGSLGALGNMSILFGFILIASGLFFYTATRGIPAIKKKAEEAFLRKEKEEEAEENEANREREEGYVENKGQIYAKGGKWSTCPKCNRQVNMDASTICSCGYDLSKLPRKKK